LLSFVKKMTLFHLFVCVFLLFVHSASCSSHSEAPGSVKHPNSDLTDFYMFRSYEPGRSQFMTFIMNIYGLQNPFGGPNYFTFSDSHFFEINIDNNGDAVEDLIIQFYHGNQLGGTTTTTITNTDLSDCPAVPYQQTVNAGIALPIGTGANQLMIPVALKVVGPVTFANQQSMNWFESYNLNLITGNRTSGTSSPITSAGTPSTATFNKPFDYAGQKSFGTAAQYEAYARSFIYNITIPNCPTQGRVFAGQRKESFNIALGRIFDLINLDPINTAQCDSNNDLANVNIGSMVLEIPISCVQRPGGTDAIGAWATVRKLVHQGGGHVPGMQTNRLGNPLVNELFIGLLDKNNFNMAVPTSDASLFLNYVTHPTLPAIIDILFRAAVNASSNIAPGNIPRTDLVATFLTGLSGINQPPNVVASEMLRINVTIPPTPQATQNSFGVIGGDSAGFPNGRRPGDDVVDIALRVGMGRLCYIAGLGFCQPSDAPVGMVDLTDGAPESALDFTNFFPYLMTPNPGSTPNPSPTTCGTSPAPSPTTTCPPASSGMLITVVWTVVLVCLFIVTI
jgi:hypothetical protein